MRATTSVARPRGRGLVSLPLLGLGLLTACLAPHEEEPDGSVQDFDRMMAKTGARPIYGTVEEGLKGGPESDPHALAEPDQVKLLEPEGTEVLVLEERVLPEENPYLRFGERILVRKLEEGPTFVTKPYPMPPGKAQKIVELMQAFEPFPFRQRPQTDPAEGSGFPLDANVVQYQILHEWDEEYYVELTASPQKAPTPIKISDLLVVTAVPDMLAEFEYFLDTFAAGVPQIELEAKIIEIVDTDSLDVGIQPIDPDTPIFQWGSSNFVKSFTYDLANLSDPTEAVLTLGGVHDGLEFNAVIEAVKTWSNVSIESRPKTVVRAGAVATLDSTQDIPYLEVSSITPNGGFNASIKYKQVGTKLYIAPRVVGSSTLALEVHLEGSQVVGFQAVVATSGEDGNTLVETPVIAYRTAKTVVYLDPGQVLVIGGLTRERSRNQQQKVPILGDIPFLGFLFRSTFEEIEKEHVIFTISPRIVQHSEFLSGL